MALLTHYMKEEGSVPKMCKVLAGALQLASTDVQSQKIQDIWLHLMTTVNISFLDDQI